MSRFAKLPHILHKAINDIGKGKHSANTQGLAGIWDYVKDKLGYKEPKKSMSVEDDPLPVYQQPEPSVQQETPLHEIWKPGYRGRTDNQSACLAKSEKENEGFMSRLKNIFGKSSERTVRRMILCHSKFGTIDENVGAFLYCSEKVPFVWHGRRQRPVNFCTRHEAVSYRQMSLLSSLRAVFGLNPRNTKPAPIREPNMPQKQEKDDTKNKKQKKPVLQTEENSEEEMMHVQSAMMDEHGNPVTEENFVRTEWGVRIKDQARKVDPQADAVETIEKPFYVVKSMWGVNVKQFMTRDEAAKANMAMSDSKNRMPAPPAKFSNCKDSSCRTKSSDTTNNYSQNSQSPQKQQPESRREVVPRAVKSSRSLSIHHITKSEVSEPKTSGKIDEMVRQVKNYADFSTAGSDRKMPEELNHNNSRELVPSDEVSAWKDVINRSKNRQNEQKDQPQASLSRSAKLPGVSVQPELPGPKRDVKAVPSSRKRHPRTGEMHGSDNAPIKVEGEKKRVGRKEPSVNPSKVDGTIKKKLHTGSNFTLYYAGTITGHKNSTSLKTSTSDLNHLLFMENNLKTTSSYTTAKKIDNDRKFSSVPKNSDECGDSSEQ